ncbi:OmpA family protein [Nocardioides sp. T2.26MG-1]|uniref:OmpA family protein n=1 Tax=Nocardioides sp. T2.26MG-1 TaxID=3041166 RepID=UPI0024775FD6|nr:OmpA family protein [Nocardioides sp. T2.26MG-1]CAI9413180.1 Peptidoglycan-associated lipoprotein [Nocardioides sp. T2.26MG-1]
MSIITRITGIAGALTLAVTLAGCSDTAAGTGSNVPTFAGSAANCEPLPQPNITPDTPTIAILGTEGDALASYAQDTGVVVAAAKTAKARIIVNGISGSADAPNLLANVVLEGEGNNNLARTNDLNCKAAKVDEALDTLTKGKSAPTPNVFDALNALAGNLSHNPSKLPVDVVLLTPLAARGGGIDLSDPKTLADPVAAINTLAAKGIVPSCENWRIYGVSPSTGLSDVMAAQLKDFWIRYAHKCGGALVAWEDHLAAFPSTTPVASADTSQIKVEQTKTEVTATLASDVLFAADSADLLDPSAPALGELLNLANKNAGKIVITGHVNPTGTGTGAGLSLQRATTVKDWLVDHDVDENRISVIGKGAADPVYPDPKTDAEKAANRRVVTVIHTEA